MHKNLKIVYAIWLLCADMYHIKSLTKQQTILTDVNYKFLWNNNLISIIHSSDQNNMIKIYMLFPVHQKYAFNSLFLKNYSCSAIIFKKKFRAMDGSLRFFFRFSGGILTQKKRFSHNTEVGIPWVLSICYSWSIQMSTCTNDF
jgi:hypothetical protein